MDSGKLNITDQSFSRTRFDSFDTQYTGMEQGLALALPTVSVDSPVTSDLPAFGPMLLPSDDIELQSLGFCVEQVPSSPALSTSSVSPTENKALIWPPSPAPLFHVGMMNPDEASPVCGESRNDGVGSVTQEQDKQATVQQGKKSLAHVISTEQIDKAQSIKDEPLNEDRKETTVNRKRGATTIEQRRERNRIHARMTRMRKKAKLDSLENQNKQLTAENQALKTENYNLRMQLQQLEVRVAASPETDTQLVTDIESPGSESAIN